MTPASFTFPEIRRGNSIPAFVIATLSYADASPVLLASAALEIRANSGVLVKRFASADNSLVIAPENTVTLAFVPGSETASFPAGTHNYDLKVNLQSGETWTVLAGHARVVPSITLN